MSGIGGRLGDETDISNQSDLRMFLVSEPRHEFHFWLFTGLCSRHQFMETRWRYRQLDLIFTGLQSG